MWLQTNNIFYGGFFNMDKITKTNCDEWKQIVSNRIESIYGKGTSIFPQSETDSRPELQDYLIRSIADYLKKEPATPLFRPQLTYSSIGMSLARHLDFLIMESEKILFPSGERYMSGLLYDEYDLAQGVSGLLSILSNFIKWTDTAA